YCLSLAETTAACKTKLRGLTSAFFVSITIVARESTTYIETKRSFFRWLVHHFGIPAIETQTETE
ncbi:MAG TPA: hypothetical protein VFY66_16660, partial [Anaerolineales bacterium]|nr:hypothetical protein [Anaerolineales bacterium]